MWNIFTTPKRNLIPNSNHCPPPPWILATINLLSVSVDLPTVDISYKWSFLTGASQHNVFKVHPYYSMYQYFISFHGQIIFYCMDIPHFIYPFISRWTVELFPLFASNKLWCYEHLCASFCVGICFHFSWVCT